MIIKLLGPNLTESWLNLESRSRCFRFPVPPPRGSWISIINNKNDVLFNDRVYAVVYKGKKVGRLRWWWFRFRWQRWQRRHPD